MTFAAKRQVFSLTKDQAANSSVPSSPLDVAVSISTPMGNKVVLSHGFRSCLLCFVDKIHSANLFPLKMSEFDTILGMDWLAEHRASIACHTNRVIFGDLNNPEFIYLFQF
ncbi:putative reverse transcriptase domain-containing protein [Tanacetum coccineum]